MKCTRGIACIWIAEKGFLRVFESQFPLNLWVQGIQDRSSNLVASTFYPLSNLTSPSFLKNYLCVCECRHACAMACMWK